MSSAAVEFIAQLRVSLRAALQVAVPASSGATSHMASGAIVSVEGGASSVAPADSFAKLVLAKRRDSPESVGEGRSSSSNTNDLKRVSARLIRLRDEPMLSLVFTHATKDITRNVDVAEGIAWLERLLAETFSHAHLTTRHESLELRISKKGQETLRRVSLANSILKPISTAANAPPKAAGGSVGAPTFFGLALKDDDRLSTGERHTASDSPATHDRPKHRFVDIRAPYLTALGVTDPAHGLVPAMARKWKQINKFVELIDHALATSGLATSSGATEGRPPIRIADFGCGKGYLTFAVHEYVSRVRRLAVQTTGVEMRPDLVEAANRIAQAAQLDGLHFEAGDLQTHQPPALDVMIALHACDTATDHAIHLGLQAGARIIMCSPCCHKELRPQMARPAALDPMLRHGVHLGQQAEMVTDSLRALLLEAEGYEARVFEFIALEHTSKNKMILATKRADVDSVAARAAMAAAREQITRIKSFYAIGEQRLETLRREPSAA